MPNCLSFWVAGVVLVAGGVLKAGSQKSEKERPGRTEYVESGCYECHGYEGQGGRGPRLAPDPLPQKTFTTITRKPPNVMPAYSPNVLSDEKLERIYEYVKSIPPPPDLSSIPLLAEE
ncbi:MAG: cytochrome c [Acidobacteriota bacterium]